MGYSTRENGHIRLRFSGDWRQRRRCSRE